MIYGTVKTKQGKYKRQQSIPEFIDLDLFFYSEYRRFLDQTTIEERKKCKELEFCWTC